MHVYGPQKTSQNNSSVIIITLLVLLVVVLVAWRWSSSSSDVAPVGDTNEPVVEYTIGERITVGGTIEEAQPLSPFYTHLLTTDLGETFGVKSSVHELSRLDNPVHIRGEFVDFRNGLYIIQVTDVEVRDSNALWGSPSQPWFYWFEEAGIGIDLSASQWYRLEQASNNDIILLDTQAEDRMSQEVFSLTPFVCTPWDPLKDCDALRRWFQSSPPETFISAENITYYNLPDTETWVAFTETYGFFLAPRVNNWTTFTSLISFLSMDDIEDLIDRQFSQVCTDGEVRLSGISDKRIADAERGLLTVTLQGPSSLQTQATCILEARLGGRVQLSLRTFDRGTQPAGILDDEDEDTSDDIWSDELDEDLDDERNDEDEEEIEDDTTEDDLPEDDTTDTSIDDSIDAGAWFQMTNPGRPWNLESWLSFPSVRGYTVYFSQAGIRYGGSFLTEPRQMAWWLVCGYKIDLAIWSAENGETPPSATLYECMGSTSAEQLERAWLIPIYQSENLLFVLHRQNNDLRDIMIYVEMNQ